ERASRGRVSRSRPTKVVPAPTTGPVTRRARASRAPARTAPAARAQTRTRRRAPARSPTQERVRARVQAGLRTAAARPGRVRPTEARRGAAGPAEVRVATRTRRAAPLRADRAAGAIRARRAPARSSAPP